MNFDEIMHLIGRWGGTMKFFPGDTDARFGIAEELQEMCSDIEQVRWLVKRVAQLHEDWPAMREVRAVFCSKFKPKDGIEVYSQSYPDGIPSERAAEPLAIAGPEMKRLAAGTAEISGSPSVTATVRQLAVSTSLDRLIAKRVKPKVPEIPVIRLTAENRITESDVRRALEENRNQAAMAEIES